MNSSIEEKIFTLAPGDLYFGDQPVHLKTLLGSCVAVILWHPKLHIGGMCHFVLPNATIGNSTTPLSRYADEAMRIFVAEIHKAGTRPAEYRAHLVGGANMFPAHIQTCADGGDTKRNLCDNCSNISCRNRCAAYAETEKHGFVIHDTDLGGTDYRLVSFNIEDGAITIKRTSVSGSTKDLTVAGI